MSTAKIAVIYYSTYGHITQLAEAQVAGAKAAGAQVDLFQIPETLSQEILSKQYAIPRPDLPVITPEKLKEYDGFIFGFPTRYGRAPAQVSAFFDATGGLWASGALVGKVATVFTSVASQHGGLETTALTTMPFFVHHGIAYVPLGFAAPELSKLDDIVGGSGYGAGTVTGSDGRRQPTEADLSVAKQQGTSFAKFASALVAGRAALATASTSAALTVPASAAPASSGYAVDTPAVKAKPAAAPAAAAAAATPAVAQKAAPAATAGEKPSQPAQPKQAKGNIFSRCCGSSKDFS